MERCYLLPTCQSWQEHLVLMCDKDKTVGMLYDKNILYSKKLELLLDFTARVVNIPPGTLRLSTGILLCFQTVCLTPFKRTM